MSHQQFDFKPSDLLKQGWCQGVASMYHNGQCVARCALTAIIHAGLTDDQEFSLRMQLFKLIGRRPIRDWNDDETQTKENVIATMEEAELKAGIN